MPQRIVIQPPERTPTPVKKSPVRRRRRPAPINRPITPPRRKTVKY